MLHRFRKKPIVSAALTCDTCHRWIGAAENYYIMPKRNARAFMGYQKRDMIFCNNCAPLSSWVGKMLIERKGVLSNE